MESNLLGSVLSVIVGSAEGAFLQVTVFVGAVLLLFGYINFRSHKDGDALFLLIAMDKKSALWATAITTVPALIFGVSIYYLEISWIGDTLKVAVDCVVTMFFG